MNDETPLISAINPGDPQRTDQLFALVYDELRKLAFAKLTHEEPGHTLQPTALVHEAYLRLAGDGASQQWDNRSHFFAAAAEAMRRILVENARSRQTLKRGGQAHRLSIEPEAIAAPAASADLLALDASLNKLAEHDAVAAQLVKLRYFSGLTVAEAAEVLSMSPRGADRLWVYAKAWLYHDLEAGERSSTSHE